MLRYQLNPHFFFNSLNSLSALIEEDADSAKQLIFDLSEFFRCSLMSKNDYWVPLSSEINLLKRYYEIEKKRFENNLEVTFDIDSDVENHPFISFLLYPLAENAIKFGMLTSPSPLRIKISAQAIDGILKLKVCNTGSWVDPKRDIKPNRVGTGTGLDNIRKRLDSTYPNHSGLSFEKMAGHVCAVITIVDGDNQA